LTEEEKKDENGRQRTREQERKRNKLVELLLNRSIQSDRIRTKLGFVEGRHDEILRETDR
jgi:hypothetical protein